jgi:hypothetical protein
MILLIGNSGAFAAKPWDLIISAKFEQSQIEITERPVLVGTITDQKGEPIFGAKVNIRFANESVITTTDEDGNFRYEFGTQDHEGMFVASISASVADLKGLSKTTLKIGSGVSTFGDLYYTKNFDANLKNDTYAALKQKQYQKFVEEQNKRKQKQYDIEAKKLAMQEKRSIIDQKRNDAINATKPGSGVYSYEDQERYISKLNPKIRDTVKAQMEYTRQIYEEAKYEMKKVLDGGGSLEDAKKAYFDKLASTQDQVQKIGGENNTENHSKIKKSQDAKINSKKVKGLTYNKYFK